MECIVARLLQADYLHVKQGLTGACAAAVHGKAVAGGSFT
jgi:hypothetical protein